MKHPLLNRNPLKTNQNTITVDRPGFEMAAKAALEQNRQVTLQQLDVVPARFNLSAFNTALFADENGNAGTVGMFNVAEFNAATFTDDNMVNLTSEAETKIVQTP